MAGFKTSSGTAGKGLRWPWIVAGALGVAAVLSQCEKEQPASVAPPVSAPVAPERISLHFSVATSQGSLGYAQGATRAEAEKKAFDACEAERGKRFAAGAYVEADKRADGSACVVRATISNRRAPACMGVFTNDIEYDYTPHVMPGSAIDITQRMRDFLASRDGGYYNTKANPQAHAFLYCVDYDGRLNGHDRGFDLARP